MRKNWLFYMDPDGGSPFMLPMESFITHDLSSPLFSHSYVPGNFTHEAKSRISKFTGAFIVWFSRPNLTWEISKRQLGSASGIYNSFAQLKSIGSKHQNLTGFCFSKGSEVLHGVFAKISGFTVRHLFNEAERLNSYNMLSLAATLIPSFNNVSLNAFALPPESTDVQIQKNIDHRPCEVSRDEFSGFSFSNLNWSRQTVEPRTGIEFPMILDDILDEWNSSKLASEVLVGTGSRTMKIIRVKSLEVYAFGFYVHPTLLCKKLGPKYASVPVFELDKCDDFYRDLLREDIDMSVRLVVNYNGLKIKTVKDAFEKSLRARLAKANPETDYHCLRAFGSFFSKDIPISAGTVIDFRRTADGRLTTEIGGSQIGTIQSKDLCRAFFDMYIGDVPVSEQTKQEIGKNVASIIKRC